MALKECLKARGVTALEGTYSTGKTSMVTLVAMTMLNIDQAIKEEKMKEAQDSIARKKTIKEMLEAESSDEEMYDSTIDT